MRPLVSVIIPTRNRARQLQAAVGSVFAQEGAGERFELDVIVVDDASADETGAILQQYGNIRHFTFAEPRGASTARNVGIEESRGSLVTFLDDDDTWLPHKLRIQLPFLKSSEVGVVYSQILQVTPEGRIAGVFPDAERGKSGWIFTQLLMDPGIVSIISVMARREAFDVVGLFDSSLVCCEESDLWLRLAFHFPFYFLSAPVAMRHISDSGLYLRGLRAGVVERDSRRMLEKALSLLPPTEAAQKQAEEARARLEIGLASELGRVGEPDRIQAPLTSGLQGKPELIHDHRVRQMVGNIAGYLARDSTLPIAAVRSLAREVLMLSRQAPAVSRRDSRELLAGIWARTAVTLGRNPRQRGMAGYSAALALLYSPLKLRNRRLISLIGSAVLRSPRDLLNAYEQYSVARADVDRVS